MARSSACHSFELLGYGSAFVGAGPGLAHELVHGTVFRTNRLNRIFLRLFSLFGWFNYNEYRMSHTFHHRYTLFPDGDREVLLPTEASLHPLVLLEMFTFNLRGALRLLHATVRMAMGKFDMDTALQHRWSRRHRLDLGALRSTSGDLS